MIFFFIYIRMAKYIYDIDLTLYSNDDYNDNDSDNDDKFYESFKHKNILRKLLLSNKGTKYLLTNANMEHAEEVLERLNLKDVFEDIISAYDVKKFKPSSDIYHVAQSEFGIKDTDKVFYFEDLKENLKGSKKVYNWSTVLINPKSDVSNESYIDYTFKTIEDAMLFFNNKEKNLKKKI
jgi:HAD superfamily hydrolase (TIGR01509 family)